MSDRTKPCDVIWQTGTGNHGCQLNEGHGVPPIALLTMGRRPGRFRPRARKRWDDELGFQKSFWDAMPEEMRFIFGADDSREGR
jgi:hypothetical protein